MLSGVLVLALPIGVIGSNFSALYAEAFEQENKKVRAILRLNGMDEEALRALYDKIDNDNNGNIDIFEMKHGLVEAGFADVDYVFLLGIFEEADLDGDGFIGWEEFKSIALRMGATVDSWETKSDDAITPQSAAESKYSRCLHDSLLAPASGAAAAVASDSARDGNADYLGSSSNDGMDSDVYVGHELTKRNNSISPLNENFGPPMIKHHFGPPTGGVDAAHRFHLLGSRVDAIRTELAQVNHRRNKLEMELEASLHALLEAAYGDSGSVSLCTLSTASNTSIGSASLNVTVSQDSQNDISSGSWKV